MEDEWLLKAGPDRVKGPLMLLVRNHHSVPCACAVREVTFLPPRGGSWNWTEIHKNGLFRHDFGTSNSVFSSVEIRAIISFKAISWY